VIVTLLVCCTPQLSLGNVFSDQAQSGCGDSLSETYLSKIREANINLFAPSSYFRGSATKFISSSGTTRDHLGTTQLDTEKLCVDNATSYTGPIQLYDDGTHGDDVANDGVYTRDCVHYCEDKVDLSDFFGYAMLLGSVYSRLIVVDESLEGTVPYEVLNTPLTPDATAIASSHAFFFADVDRKYYPNFPTSMSPNASDWPSGKSVGISALLSVFGDAFDYLTVTPLEKDHVEAIGGAGIYKWQHWDRRGGPMINNRIGDIEECFMAVSGVPTYRLTGIVTNGDVVEETGGENHELVHGVSGYSYHMNLEKARNGDNAHIPGACTTDHSSLQGPVWDWVVGYPMMIPASDPQNMRGVRIEPNDDCQQCDDNALTSCCSFRYLDIPNTREKMLASPELSTMSPLMLYIAGMIKADEVPEDKRTYYCMGSNTDGGCGADGDRKIKSMFASKYRRDHYSPISNISKAAESRPECVYKVDASDRSKVASEYVSRFTLDELIDANGGTRFPEERFKVVRNAAIHISSRLPSEAEIVFYTMLWRHHETEVEPWNRLEEGRPPVEPWYFHTGGHSVLHSRLHGIDCGEGGADVPSCFSGNGDVCEGYPCGAGAVCKDLDGRPFCMCREGLVGDGIECTFASETLYDKRPSAHELGQGYKEHCFAENSDWTDFVSESSLPPYPGGQAPYSPTSCGSNVCRAGWGCNKNKGTCLKPKGSSICEKQSGLSKGECLALGCCKWAGGQKKCKRRRKNNKCPLPKDPSVKKSCTDLNTCCYFDCNYLEFDNESQIGQVGNCGPECTTGIKPDLNGVKHPELYLWPNIYITNHDQYGYDNDSGPMNIQGDDKNMFNRCMASCFTGGEDMTQEFLYKIKKNGTLSIRTCGWLFSRGSTKKRTICTGNAYNLSQRGYKSARIACPDTCA